MRGGWVGSNVWDKVPKKQFFLRPSLMFVLLTLKLDFPGNLCGAAFAILAMFLSGPLPTQCPNEERLMRQPEAKKNFREQQLWLHG